MTDTSTITINEDAKEAKDYFKILKASTSKIDEAEIQGALDQIAEHLIKAESIGQKSFRRRLAFTGDVLLKEQFLFHRGFKDFVLVEDIKKYIDKVKPANSVKIIELERYPRVIPWECMERIAKAQSFNVFSDFCVVFTDFSDNDYKTEEEKKLVARNRDPVVFGYFIDKQTGDKHDRFYLITDWEDEYCDLTFSKLIQEMSAKGIKSPSKQIGQDALYIQGLIGKAMDDTTDKVKKKSFWSKFKWLK